jgi:hypothetical protein
MKIKMAKVKEKKSKRISRCGRLIFVRRQEIHVSSIESPSWCCMSLPKVMFCQKSRNRNGST